MLFRRGAAVLAFALFALPLVMGSAMESSLAAPTATSASAKPSGSAKKPAPVASASAKEPKTPKAIASPFKPGLTPNANVQKAIAGAPSPSDSTGAESTELRALREAEIDLFGPGAAPAPGVPWPSDLPSAPKGPLSAGGSGGLPPAPVDPPPPPPAIGGKSLAWLAGLKMPDIPVRWDSRVVKYLEFFRDDPRGRKILAVWWRRSGRYRELIQESLRARSMPEDIAWLAMVESGFDPLIKSPAGAAGLWQFMPDAGKIYGLSVDRWADGRNSPLRATSAAIAYLADLKKRFGTWELAMASYNMGYGGALSAVKRFNSNDYWELSKFENGLPWETTLYVPKIIAVAVATRNPQVFGLDAIVQDSSLKGDSVEVPAGTELKAVAQIAGCPVKELESLNPELRAGRTPPALENKGDNKEDASYTILVPSGKASSVKDASGKLAPKGNQLEKYIVRFGETLDQIALARKTTKAKLVELNAISKDESVRGGTVLLVPQVAGLALSSSPFVAPPLDSPLNSPLNLGAAAKPIALVPGVSFAYADRRRVFYRVLVGDTPREIADAFAVTVDELKTWNAIDPTARLQEGMQLQIFVSKTADLSRVVFLKEGDVKLLAVGSDEFYDHEEALKGRKRTTVHATGGESLEALGKKHSVTPAMMEKINRRPRSDVLTKGEAVIVYVPIVKGAPAPPSAVAEGDLPAVPATEAKKVDPDPTEPK
jgi:membrane-bound lytic murein transglycosylase D